MSRDGANRGIQVMSTRWIKGSGAARTGAGWTGTGRGDLSSIRAASFSGSLLTDGKLRRRIERDYTWNAGTSGWQQTNEIHFVYDGNLVIQERDINNQPQVTYTRGKDLSGQTGSALNGAGGIGGLLARSDRAQSIPGIVTSGGVSEFGTPSYYHADGNGNVTMLIAASQMIVAKYLYDPFGNTLAKCGLLADVNNYRFSSKEWNGNSGLYYYLYRFYDPNLERWPNRDPIEEQGGINLYDFVQNNPMGIVDLLGLDCYRQNRQLAPKLLNHSPWPRSRYNPLSHTFIFTTNPDGTLNNTYSWGTDANPRGWVENFGPDRAAANQALGMGGNYLNKIGDSSLDNPMDKAFNDLKQNEPEHGNGLIDNNCKSEATCLEDKAKQIQQRNQDQNSCSFTAN